MVVTKNRRFPIVLLILASMFLATFGGCLFQKNKQSDELSFEGLKLVAWDAAEPSFSRSDAYQQTIQETAEEFSGKYGVQVDIKFVSREDILEFIYGSSDVPEPPSVIYSSEYPAMPEGAKEISRDVPLDDYLDQTTDFWSPQDQLMGVPAYVHWVGMAVRAGDLGEGGTISNSGYWPDSQWFLASAIDFPEQQFGADAATAYLEWLKSTVRGEQEEPLDAWENSAVNALWPVTPHMYCWLKSSSEGQVDLRPIENPFGDPRFYCAVPGYMVLANEEPEKSCATLLAKALARKRGLWAARNIGAIPAAIGDVAIFDLEAPLSQDEKCLIRECSVNVTSACLSAEEALWRRQIWQGFARITEDFLKGAIPPDDLSQSILELWESHTKP